MTKGRPRAGTFAPSDAGAWQEDRLQQYGCPVATNQRLRFCGCQSQRQNPALLVLSVVIHSGQKQEMSWIHGSLQMFLPSFEEGC